MESRKSVLSSFRKTSKANNAKKNLQIGGRVEKALSCKSKAFPHSGYRRSSLSGTAASQKQQLIKDAIYCATLEFEDKKKNGVIKAPSRTAKNDTCSFLSTSKIPIRVKENLGVQGLECGIIDEESKENSLIPTKLEKSFDSSGAVSPNFPADISFIEPAFRPPIEFTFVMQENVTKCPEKRVSFIRKSTPKRQFKMKTYVVKGRQKINESTVILENNFPEDSFKSANSNPSTVPLQCAEPRLSCFIEKEVFNEKWNSILDELDFDDSVTQRCNSSTFKDALSVTTQGSKSPMSEKSDDDDTKFTSIVDEEKCERQSMCMRDVSLLGSPHRSICTPFPISQDLMLFSPPERLPFVKDDYNCSELPSTQLHRLSLLGSPKLPVRCTSVNHDLMLFSPHVK